MLAFELHLSTWTVSFIVGALLPFVVGLATKYVASDFLKGLVNFVCSGIAAMITMATTVDGSAVISQATLVAWFLTFVTSRQMYQALYGPKDINAHLAPNTGLNDNPGA